MESTHGFEARNGSNVNSPTLNSFSYTFRLLRYRRGESGHSKDLALRQAALGIRLLLTVNARRRLSPVLLLCCRIV
jgi:hypothetical protein